MRNTTVVPKFLFLVAYACLLDSHEVNSQEVYPSRPIRIMTAAPGGGLDFAARLVAQGISAPLGQPVVVENRGGLISQQTVAQALPDGYTLLFHSGGTWLAPFVTDTAYDPVKDFSPITLVSKSPSILVVHPSLPVKSVKELIALAKAKPGALNFAAGITAAADQLAGELFKIMAGVDIVRIAYKGGSQALNDLIGGHVQFMFPTAGTVAPHVKSGRVRPLAITSAQPSAVFPDLPTVAATLPGYEALQIIGVWVPSKTPAAIINRLNREIAGALSKPEIKEKFLGAGVESASSLPEQFSAIINADMAKWGKVIKQAGIRE